MQSFYDSLTFWHYAGHGPRGQAPLTVVSVNTPEPLGTFEVALRHAARLLERDAAAAAEQAAEILKVHPDQPDALALSGLALGRLGKGEEAIAALRRAVHFKPELPDAWRALGDHYTRAGDARGGRRSLRTAPAPLDARSEAHGARRWRWCENRIPDAEATLREHLKRHPTDVVAIRMLAEVAARIGRTHGRRDAAGALRGAGAGLSHGAPELRHDAAPAEQVDRVAQGSERPARGRTEQSRAAQSQGGGARPHRRTTKSPSRCTAGCCGTIRASPRCG